MMILLVATGYLLVVYVLLILAQRLAKRLAKISSPKTQQVSSSDC